MAKNRTIKELEDYCVNYTLFMGEHSFTQEEIIKLNKKYKVYKKYKHGDN